MERERGSGSESDLRYSENKTLASGPSPQPENLCISISLTFLTSPAPHPSPSLSSFASVVCVIICQAPWDLVCTSAPALCLPPTPGMVPLRTEPSSPETAHGLLLSLCGLGPALGMGSCLETGTHTACLTDAGPAGLGSLYLPGELAGHAHHHPSPRAKPGPRHKASLPGDQPHNSVTLRKLSLSLQTSLSLF